MGPSNAIASLRQRVARARDQLRGRGAGLHCILDVGPPKTGTTSIQHFVRDHKSALAERGYFIPETLHPNMREFAYAADAGGLFRPKAGSPARMHGALGLSHESYFDTCAQIRADLEAQMKAAVEGGHFHSMIISSENLAYIGSPGGRDYLEGLPPDQGLAHLRGLLAPYCKSVSVIYALRRQDLISVSFYATAVRSNHVQEHHELLREFLSLDFDEVLGLWGDAFGKNALRPFLFPDSAPGKSPGILHEFCTAAGLMEFYDPALEDKYWRNQSADGRALEIQRLLNTRYLKQERDMQLVTPMRRRVEVLLDRHLYEQPFEKTLPSRADAEAFVARYAASNEEVRKRYFPASPTLFHDDFSKYPEAGSFPEPTTDDLMRLLALLITDTQLNKRLDPENK